MLLGKERSPEKKREWCEKKGLTRGGGCYITGLTIIEKVRRRRKKGYVGGANGGHIVHIGSCVRYEVWG